MSAGEGYVHKLCWKRKVEAYFHWLDGRDTLEISRLMLATEAAVYNALYQVREHLRAEMAA